MQKYFFLLSISLVILFAGCDLVDLIEEAEDSEITAKLKIGEVLNTARSNFSNDAELSAIYGSNVSVQGQVDLLKPTQGAFVYVVQSDSLQSNEFYIPVFNSTPIKSPVNFVSMLSFVKNQTAKNILSGVFGQLSTIHIDASVNYSDSPAVIELMFQRTDVVNFRSANPVSKIDMFLIPGKSIDSLSVTNTADWIVNFNSDTTSLVLWLHPGTTNGTITKISD